MPTPCYISIEGKTQGNITAGAFTSDSVGNIFVQGHEDEMLVQEFNHQVTVPTDPQSGQPAGQRVHKPRGALASSSPAEQETLLEQCFNDAPPSELNNSEKNDIGAAI